MPGDHHPEPVASTRVLAYIGLGSNQDGPARQLETAIGHLARLPHCRLVARSSFYASAPFGPVKQADFINAAIALETRLSAYDLFDALQQAEASLGRSETQRWGPRRIDLDLLVFGDEIVKTPALQVPHPGIAGRNFVLLPLIEIAPQLVIPGLGHIADLAVNYNEPRIARITDNE